MTFDYEVTLVSFDFVVRRRLQLSVTGILIILGLISVAALMISHIKLSKVFLEFLSVFRLDLIYTLHKK